MSSFSRAFGGLGARDGRKRGSEPEVDEGVVGPAGEPAGGDDEEGEDCPGLDRVGETVEPRGRAWRVPASGAFAGQPGEDGE